MSDTEPRLKVVNLRETAPLVDVPGKLRDMAAAIERGDYGDVNEAVFVLMGDSLEVFGWGQLRDPTSAAALLAAAHMRLIRAIERHGQE